jgi:hypothetical protein
MDFASLDFPSFWVMEIFFEGCIISQSPCQVIVAVNRPLGWLAQKKVAYFSHCTNRAKLLLGSQSKILTANSLPPIFLPCLDFLSTPFFLKISLF